MDKGWICSALAASLLAFVIAPLAEARDPDVAAGIQYVIRGSKEDIRTLEEARHLFGKAVIHLNKGLAKDPKDDEAWLYLGTAYGELDSLEQAGRSFAEAIRRLKDNPKLLKRASDYRDYYFNNAYNQGTKFYRDATTILPAEEITNSTEPKAAEAKAKLAEAEGHFRGALLINPEKAIAYDKLATVLELQSKFDQAREVMDEGLANSVPKEGEEYESLVKRKATGRRRGSKLDESPR